MDVNSGRLIQLAPDEALPEGFERLPDALQPSAEALISWAADKKHTAPVSTAAAKAKRKRERQNRKAGRARR